MDNTIQLTGSLAIKVSVQGTLIYLSMAIYLLSLLLYLMRFKVVYARVYAIGFLVALVSVIWRWWSVAHIPLQNMFEVFLVLGAAGLPVSFFCKKYLNVGGIPGDILLSIVFLFPAGFVFSEARQFLPPALQSPLFGPHVLAYMLAYFIMAKAAFQGAMVVIKSVWKDDLHIEHGCESDNCICELESGVYKVISLGFPLLTSGLIIGSVWGKLAWGDYWNWDPKELWSLASWLVYLIYFHWRFSFGQKYTAINGLLAVLGFIFIIITLLWVNLSRVFSGLHSYSS